MTTTLRPPAPPRPRALPPREPAPPTWRQRLATWDFRYSPYLYVAPFFVLFGLVGLFPLAYTFVVSLNDWNLLTGAGDWIGFENYAVELADPLFWNSVYNTFSIFLLSTVPQLAVAAAIAAILDQNLRAKTFWRMSVILPYIVTPVAVAIIFSSMFGERYGLVNNLLTEIGLDPVMWKTETLPSHLAIATMVNWRWTGYNALILLAAMQAVPRDVHESAALDGAGSVRRFFSITVPSIRPTLVFVIITATIGGLQIFTEPKLFNAASSTPGGPQRQYQTTVLYLWDLAFNRQDFGKASAVAWILFLLIVLIGLLNFWLSRRIAGVEARGSARRTRRAITRFRAQPAAPAPGATSVPQAPDTVLPEERES
ncbi:carbohydrate ABC transporter permease [Clavibacter sepedonicus]|uniref:Sugar transport integral membrane protein n=1 Tax=Clavibacter sepedonicus TaxID=31964 RepID=B0RD16_CLASE|nr:MULTISPECIES: sugar ABC transporter permease [Clavibacter]MBD5382508.1 sugar ABC transporter permease [Clavibacter sp.]OQJ48538.1 ABC transporter permease [Clavibacter sepedonicus]OQJ54082.1 ABC transporter permease [Clavibacter sepedonicus]UUK65617.1 sugar ABC transporter permease [Clavibacter sepedonicus]CAQ03109.1 putative sugar transport integral membrane protein [Clavibacter sepedonicus]